MAGGGEDGSADAVDSGAMAVVFGTVGGEAVAGGWATTTVLAVGVAAVTGGAAGRLE